MCLKVLVVYACFLNSIRAVCPPNEKLNNCENECEPTCQNRGNFVCISQNKRCICQSGLLRDLTSGKCIPPNLCPKDCGIHEQWSTCTTPACRQTCQRKYFRFCPLVCIAGCECVKGYIWDEYCNACVPEDQCSKVCGINEEWKQCSDGPCRATCQNQGPLACKIKCSPGCSCKEGFIWDELVNQCVPRNQCSKPCGENEQWRQCSDRNCRTTCQNTYLKWCSMTCVSGCSCKDGFIWDEHFKKCVRRAQCSKVCHKNAEWRNSIPNNVPTCRTFRQTQSFDFTRQSGCICKQGFVLEEYSQKCVRRQDCTSSKK